MKKKYGVAVAMAALAAVLASGCGAKKAESAASSAESTAAAMSSAGESAASELASKGESAASEAAAQMLAEKHKKLTVADGTYQVNVTLSGGSGRAKIASPTELTVKDGRATAKIVWSSDKYDYMEVEGIRFTPEIQNGHSVFMVPVTELDKPLAMVGDTTAMSTPHAIDYQLTFELQK